MSQHIVFNLVFNKDSKMGVCHFCMFCILKVIVKKNNNNNSPLVRFSDYFLNILL
jgi:hypothetical protein